MKKRFDILDVNDIIPLVFENYSAWLAKIAHLLQLDVSTVIKN